MIDYYENILSESRSRAPFNLWLFSMKFELMCPRLIYRSYIFDNDAIETKIFPGRDASVPISVFKPTDYSRARNLTIEKLRRFAETLGINVALSANKRALLEQIEAKASFLDIDAETALDSLARFLYWPDIEHKISNLPTALRGQLNTAALLKQPI